MEDLDYLVIDEKFNDYITDHNKNSIHISFNMILY